MEAMLETSFVVGVFANGDFKFVIVSKDYYR